MGLLPGPPRLMECSKSQPLQHIPSVLGTTHTCLPPSPMLSMDVHSWSRSKTGLVDLWSDPHSAPGLRIQAALCCCQPGLKWETRTRPNQTISWMRREGKLGAAKRWGKINRKVTRWESYWRKANLPKIKAGCHWGVRNKQRREDLGRKSTPCAPSASYQTWVMMEKKLLMEGPG